MSRDDYGGDERLGGACRDGGDSAGTPAEAYLALRSMSFGAAPPPAHASPSALAASAMLTPTPYAVLSSVGHFAPSTLLEGRH